MFAGSSALAQETLLEHVVAACETDLQNYCSQVTPGNGRLLHCMAVTGHAWAFLTCEDQLQRHKRCCRSALLAGTNWRRR